MKVLVTGGAGYIGSQMVRQLIENKISVVVVDSLERGHRAAVPPSATLYIGDIGNEKFLREIFSAQKFDAVMHFAGYISMGESVAYPGKYFRNNTTHTLTLLDAMRAAGVARFVFSSSAGVYGPPTQIPISENHPRAPANPYGESKWMVEQMLARYDAAHQMRSISLRYFNAAGATLDGAFGEDHPDETHIIPLALRAGQEGKPFQLFGADYPTRDGACVRDYIHVIDLCAAHLLALDALMHGHATAAYNVGSGRGYSNREVVAAVQKISGLKIETHILPRRPGDVSELVADSSRVRAEFGWTPRVSDLETIVQSAYQWHHAHPRGYADK